MSDLISRQEAIEATTTGTSFWNCKYHLPCGYCELKKTECNWWQTLNMPCENPIKVTWKPNLNEVTCSAERSEDGRSDQ